MFIARKSNGTIADISSTLPSEYGLTCPFCGTEVIQKRGGVTRHHFAHKSKIECDDWAIGDNTEFRVNWISNFTPNKSVYEIICSNEVGKHKIDLGFEDKLGICVISKSLTREEWLDRIAFYKSFYKDVVFIVDCSDKEIEQTNITESAIAPDIRYGWKRPSRAIPSTLYYEGVHIFLQINDNRIIYLNHYDGDSLKNFTAKSEFSYSELKSFLRLMWKDDKVNMSRALILNSKRNLYRSKIKDITEFVKTRINMCEYSLKELDRKIYRYDKYYSDFIELGEEAFIESRYKDINDAIEVKQIKLKESKKLDYFAGSQKLLEELMTKQCKVMDTVKELKSYINSNLSIEDIRIEKIFEFNKLTVYKNMRRNTKDCGYVLSCLHEYNMKYL